MRRPRLVLLDRDGVVNDLWYDASRKFSDSPRSRAEMRLKDGAADAIKMLNSLAIPCAIVSNQPGIAKAKMSCANLDDVTEEMTTQLKLRDASVDQIYYCLHHPEAVNVGLRLDCPDRKPRNGMLLRAMSDFGASPRDTWMIGDTANDILAGKAALCWTAWVRGIVGSQTPDFGDFSPDISADGLQEIIGQIVTIQNHEL